MTRERKREEASIIAREVHEAKKETGKKKGHQEL